MPMIQTKRVYEPAAAAEGHRFLVDRLWPRGFRKEEVQMDAWLQEVSPSRELCRWFGHEPSKWEEFQRRYTAELNAQPRVWQPLLEAARKGTVTLLYSARDTSHNNAVVLKGFLEEQLAAKAAPQTRRASRSKATKA